MTICDNLNVRVINDETVILNRSTNQIHTLNPTASFIWRLIEEESSTDFIIKQLTESYDISADTAASDLDKILKELAELKLIKQP